MRAVAQQNSITLPKSLLARFCATCSLIHVPGANCAVRARVSVRSKQSRERIGRRITRKTLLVVRSCWTCGVETRQPCESDAQGDPRSGSRALGRPASPVQPRAGGRTSSPAQPTADLFGSGSDFIAFTSL
jgi:RNase P subunit RPR2